MWSGEIAAIRVETDVTKLHPSISTLAFVILLTGCTTNAQVCENWKRKTITARQAMRQLAIPIQTDRITTKDAVTIKSSDGTKTSSDLTVQVSEDFPLFAYCLGVKNKLINTQLVPWVRPQRP